MFLILIQLLLVFSALYFWRCWRQKSSFWAKHRVPYVDVTNYASWFDLFMNRASLTELDLWTYRQGGDAKFVGVFDLLTPRLLVRDIDLLKSIMIKDFDHFVDRRPFSTGNEIQDRNMFALKGSEWKNSRMLMSPVFSTSKIRRMFPHMDRSTSQFQDYVKLQAERSGSNDIELRDIFGRYTMDVIAGSVFGLDARCLTDDTSAFLAMGKRLQGASIWRTIKMMTAMFFPRLFKMTGVPAFGDQTSLDFFQSIIRKAIKVRKEKGDEYQDFIGAFVNQAYGKNKAKFNEAELNQIEKDMLMESEEGGNWTATEEDIIGNALAFFFAGFDVTETLLTVAAYQMALNPEIQTRLREEVDGVCEEFGGKITYDGVAKMQYLDQVLHECLRRYPPGSAVDRKVTKPYKIPGTDIELPVGMIVGIPIFGVHMDPKHYPEPEKFDPERFSPENSAKRNHFAWMPFGQGPRGCVAMRFALVISKAAIAHLVRGFEMRPCEDTWVPLRMDNIPGSNKPSKGLKVAMYPRNLQ